MRIKQGSRREVDRDAQQHIIAIQSPLPKMAPTLCSSSTCTPTTPSSLFSSFTLRRRLPLVGAFCMLSLGLSNLYTPSYSSALKTGCVLSLLRYSLFRLRNIVHFLFLSLSIEFNSIASVSDRNWVSKSHSTVRMEANSTTVPSIVVYVTVPNKEAGTRLGLEHVRLFKFFNLSLLFSRALVVVQVRSWLKALSQRSLQLV